MSLHPDRRQHPRLEQNIPLKISSGEVDIVTQTKNLSCAGALCLINKFIAPMTKLRLHLLLPLRRSHGVATKRVSCEGVVIRSQSTAQGFQTAIFFSDISARDKLTLREFVDSILHTHGSCAA